MKKNILLFILVLIPIVFAQETHQKDPNIELPEFVITGIERVALPVLPKPKADIVTIISDDFIKPSYSPEELNISTLSDPEKKDADIFQKVNSFYGNVNAGLGIYTLPTGQISLGSPFQNGLINVINMEKQYINIIESTLR